MSIVENLIEL